MDFSATQYGLPRSRTDALSVVVLGVISAFFGSTPCKGKYVALTATVVANLWAIASSVLTLHDVVGNPNGIEAHFFALVCEVLVLTIVTSALTLHSFLLSFYEEQSSRVFWCGIITVVLTFVSGLAELVLAYTKGCDKTSFANAALCNHTTNFVVSAVVAISASGLVGGCLVGLFTADGHCSVVQNAWAQLRDGVGGADQPHSVNGAILTRTSALTKACLLGVYWWLVDADLTWDYTVNSHDMNLWVTGQWAKQGAAIANNLFHHLG